MNILIVSHRRSGTHLTIDLIRNNFINYSFPYVSLDELSKREKIDFIKYKLRSENKYRIYKSHSDINYKKHYESAYISSFFEYLLDKSKIIYVYRNVFDMLLSLYNHYKIFFPKIVDNLDFFDFVNMKNDYHAHELIDNEKRYLYWADHINGWSQYNGKILFLNFNEIINEYNLTIKKVANFLDEKEFLVKDVRLQNQQNINRDNSKIEKLSDIKRTSVNFQIGKCGLGLKKFPNKLQKEIKHKIIYKNEPSKILENCL